MELHTVDICVVNAQGVVKDSMLRSQFSYSEFGDLGARVNVAQPCAKCKSVASKESRKGMEGSSGVGHKNDGVSAYSLWMKLSINIMAS